MQVSSKTLYRLGGAAALLGGLLRIIFSFVPYREATAWLEGFYAFIDICLLFGLIAVYLRYAEHLGAIGTIAFVCSTIGIASIVGPDPIVFGIDFYQVGALIMISGLLVLSIQMLRNKILLWASCLWILSFALTILAAVSAHPILFISAAISFSTAFILSGVQLLRSQG